MKKSPPLIISQEDFNKIMPLLSQAAPDLNQLLEEELSRATIVSSSELPTDRVAMNSKITFKDLDTGGETTVRLVYPHEADSDKYYISILAPIGAALIGLRVGQEILWPVPSGKKRLVKVTSVTQENSPESVL